MVQYGMNSKIGNVAYPEPKDGDIVLERPYSQATANLIDTEVRNLVTEAYKRTEKLLSEKREGLEKVAQLLLQKEVLKREDLEQLLGTRLFDEQTTFAQLS